MTNWDTYSSGRPRARLLHAMLSASILIGLAACSEGCVHEQRDIEPVVERPVLTLTELEAWTWPLTPETWCPLDEAQLVALEQLVSLLVEQAESGQLSPAQARTAAALATLTGVELHHVILEVDDENEPNAVELWVVSEPADDRRGRGIYLIRVGPIGERGSGVELLIQAPHSRFDKHTGTIALDLFLEGDAGPPRALFMNSAHRYRQVDGTREKREPATANLADAAHNSEHPIARVTARLLEQRELAVIQLHGFGRSAEAGDPDLIISGGVSRPQRVTTSTLQRLRLALPDHAMGHFGIDTDRLGARNNVQGHAARDTDRCFIHIELSEGLRKQLLGDRDVRRRFAGAVFEVDEQELRGGCR